MDYDLIIDLDNCTKKKKLGEGQFAIVYLVQDNQTKQEMVAKERKIECKSADDQINFFKELKAFSMIKNAATLSLIGFNMTNFEQEHLPTIFTSYMPNGSLDKLLKNNI